MELLRIGSKLNCLGDVGTMGLCGKSYPSGGVCNAYTCTKYTDGQCPIVCNNVAV